MRLQPESLPDPADRGPRQTRTFRHGCPRPVSRVSRRILQCIDDDFFYLLVGDRRLMSRARLISQAVQALINKPLTPLPDRCLMTPEQRCGFLIVVALRAGQDDIGPQCQGLQYFRPPCPPLESGLLITGKHQFGLRPPRPRHIINSTDAFSFIQLLSALRRCDLAHLFDGSKIKDTRSALSSSARPSPARASPSFKRSWFWRLGHRSGHP